MMRPYQLLGLVGFLCASLAAAAPCYADAEANRAVKEAEGRFRQGQAADAEKLLLAVTDLPPKGLQLLGQVQLRLRKYELALKTFERYVAIETVSSKRSAGETMVAELKVLTATRFKIATTPPGASVYIDSKAEGAVGTTPLSQMVTPGRHKIILELAGHEAIKVDVSAVEQQELELPFTMLPLGCETTITSEPAKAKVFIDGKGMGQAPVGRRLRAGVYRIEGVLVPGEPPVARTITCDDKDQKPIQVHLTPDQPSAPPEIAKAPDAPPPAAGKPAEAPPAKAPEAPPQARPPGPSGGTAKAP